MGATKIYDPNMSISVLDKSVPASENESDALDYSLGVLIAGFSSKGRDNVITENKTSAVIMSTYGDDFASFTKYGQANITALAVAKSKGRVFFCRLLPDDAKRAYTVFGVSVKKKSLPAYERVDTIYSADRTSVMSLGMGTFTLDANNNKVACLVKTAVGDTEATKAVTVDGAELTLETKKLESTMFDDDGAPTKFDGGIMKTVDNGIESIFYPLFALYYYGRGKGGKMFGFTIDRDTGRDKALSDGRRYYMTFFEETSAGSQEPLYSEPYYFAFNPAAKFSADSTVIDGLSTVYQNRGDDDEELPIQMIPYDDNYALLTAALSEFKDSSESNDDIDFINGVFKNGNAYNKIVFSATSIDIGNTIVTLDDGTDGSLELGVTVNGKTVTQADIDATKIALLSRFFSCKVDESILDEKIIDADVLPDCNYPAAVKKTILSIFSTYRPDIALRMDCGISTSYTEALNIFAEYSGYVNTEFDYMVSFNGSCGTLKDPNIGSPYKITYVYDYIKGLADNFATGAGAFQMHAGSNRGRVKYMRPAWFAHKSLNNMFEKLEDAKLNYIEKINKNGEFMYGCERSQNSTAHSKLNSDRNGLVIGRARKICQKELINYKYDERDITSTLKSAKKACLDAIQASNIPSSIIVDVSVYQTKQDAKTENAHCDITFTFPDYAKTWTVTIIAKRPSETSKTSSSTATTTASA